MRPVVAESVRGRPPSRLLVLLGRPFVRTGLLVGLAAALFFGAGPRGATLTGDPIVYAEIGREIVERGDPTRLTLLGKMVARKPPLEYWMEAAAFAALGSTDFVARLPSRLMGLATLALLMSLVSRAHGRRAAFWAGLCCVAWPVFQRSAYTCRLETTLAFFTLASLGAWLRTDRLGFSPARALGVGALLGLSILSKGPPGLLVAAAIAAGSLLARRGRLLLRAAPLVLLALFAVAGSWYALQVAREGPAFWEQLHADWTRGTAPVSSVWPAIELYATDVFAPAAPWIVPLACGVALAVRRIRTAREDSLPDCILLSLVAALLSTMPFLRMHYSRYFVQVVPAFAWLAGPWLAPALRFRHLARPSALEPHRAAALVLALAAGIGYPAFLAANSGATHDRYPGLRAAAAALREAAPDARALPVTSAGPRRGEGEAPLPLASAAQFYFGMRLEAFEDGNPAQPPLVLFLHGSAGPADAKAFEALHPFVVVYRDPAATLYRTR